ncbi:MAG: CBS domain-containing protein [Candidatus Omnitrophota bacterium]|jgi:acetoin utilization protein AcuB
MDKLYKIFLKTIMIKEPHVINIGEPFSRTWDMFKTYDIRHLPIVDDNGILKGIVTQRDLYRIESPRMTQDGELMYVKDSLDAHILKQVMTRDVFTLSPDDTLGTALDAMIREKYGCIPIVDDRKHLVGIITRANVLETVSEYFI